MERNQNAKLSLFDTLNEISSPDFYICLETHGKLESLPKKRHLQNHFAKLIDETDYDDLLHIYMLRDIAPDLLPTTQLVHGNWKLIGRLMPVRTKEPPKIWKVYIDLSF